MISLKRFPFHMNLWSACVERQERRPNLTTPEIIWEVIVILQDLIHDKQCNQICSGSLNALNLNFNKRETVGVYLREKKKSSYFVCKTTVKSQTQKHKLALKTWKQNVRENAACARMLASMLVKQELCESSLQRDSTSPVNEGCGLRQWADQPSVCDDWWKPAPCCALFLSLPLKLQTAQSLFCHNHSHSSTRAPLLTLSSRLISWKSELVLDRRCWVWVRS